MIGLDIGSKTIKTVELVESEGKFLLKSAGIVSYQGTQVEHVTTDKELSALAQVIKKLFHDVKVGGKEIVLGLSESQVFTRPIKLPLLTDAEIASAVKWEAEQYIPIPIQEAIIQHQILERRENAVPPEVLVLLVAAPRLLVEKYLKLLDLAGLEVIVVETELLSLVRALAPENQTALIIDFGAKSTDIAISRNANLAFSRSIPTAGETFTRAVAQSLGITAQAAEEYKKTYGLSGNQLEAKVKLALDPIFKIVVDEIKKAVHFYQTEEKGEAPTSIVLSGGTSGLPDVVTYFTNQLGIEVVIGNPFQKVELDPKVAEQLSPYAPIYSVAVGLALRNSKV